MKIKKNGYKTGSGCFTCGSCGRLTRDTHNDNGNLKTCPDCYELGGIENEISDKGTTPELEREAQQLRDKIKRFAKMPEED